MLKLKTKIKPHLCDAAFCRGKEFNIVNDAGLKLCTKHAAEYDGPAAEPTDTSIGIEPPESGMQVISETVGEPKTESFIETPASDRDNVLAIVEPVRVEAETDLVKLQGIAVKSQAGLDAASELLKTTKGKIKSLEAQRTAVTKPLLEAKKNVDGWFKPAKHALEALEQFLKDAISGYITETEKRKLEALKAGDHETALAMQPPELSKGVTTRTTWKFEIENVDAIPREYMVPDAAKIQQHVTTYKSQSTIPGIRVYPDTGISSRSE